MARECGDCQLCCNLIGVAELAKSPHSDCIHQCKSGCAIHSSRPKECRTYQCQWRSNEEIPDDLRPDKIGCIIDLHDTPLGLASVVREDIEFLKQGTMKPSRGDLRCIIYGHLIRLAIWSLRAGWNKKIDTKIRLSKIESWISEFGGLNDVEIYLNDLLEDIPVKQFMGVRESEAIYGRDDEIPF